MWYCSIEFVSGKRKVVVFQDETEANNFIYTVTNSSNDSFIYSDNNNNGIYINIKNIEEISEPKEYKENE
ncbi:hypothetical protein [Heyndrickxia sporothermodurans]